MHANPLDTRRYSEQIEHEFLEKAIAPARSRPGAETLGRARYGAISAGAGRLGRFVIGMTQCLQQN